MLEVSNLNTFYGKVQALWDVSLKINEAEIVALVGANAAGISTLLNTISGLIHPASGNVEFLGKKIVGLPPNVIAEMGISHIPEGRRLFSDMSVRENLDMGAYAQHAWKQRGETIKQVYELFPLLKEREGQLARTLSGGEQQMLAMGRGLMSRPTLCMFDEPSSGLAPMLVLEVFQVIKRLHEQGITVLVVEQNVRHTLELANRAYVLENGRLTMEGTGDSLLASEHVKKAYLGL
jgi:branched-chain amino acid transport system ATP-binding protein